jgi:hypothetical protein
MNDLCVRPTNRATNNLHLHARKKALPPQDNLLHLNIEKSFVVFAEALINL